MEGNTEQISAHDGAAADGRAPVVVLGGGPAGLTAGYLLAKRGLAP